MSGAANKDPKRSLFFFLGGYDLEMVTIRELLVEHAPGLYYDRKLSWGARASNYRTEIEAVLGREDVPVLVELAMDLPLDPDRMVVVDHHGERAGMENRRPWSRCSSFFAFRPKLGPVGMRL